MKKRKEQGWTSDYSTTFTMAWLGWHSSRHASAGPSSHATLTPSSISNFMLTMKSVKYLRFQAVSMGTIVKILQMNEFRFLLLRYIGTDISLTTGKLSLTIRSRTVVLFRPFPSIFEGLILINQSAVALLQIQRLWMAPK